MILNKWSNYEGSAILLHIDVTPELYLIISKHSKPPLSFFTGKLVIEIVSCGSSSMRFLDYVNGFNRAISTSINTLHYVKNKNDLFGIFNQSTAQKIQDNLVGFFDDEDFTFNSPPKTVEKVESVELLKCKCFYCEDTLSPSQYYRFDKDKYEISTTCGKCNRRDTVLLSDLQIKQCNAQGGYQMSMGK